MVTFPKQSEELIKLLHEDQTEKRELGRLYFAEDKEQLGAKQAEVNKHSHERAQRMLEILDEIEEPS